MLQKSDLLLQFLRVISQVVGLHHVLLFSRRHCLPFIVEECMAIRVDDDLGAVIEEHSCGLVGEQVSKSVLTGVVHPLLDPTARTHEGSVFHHARASVLLTWRSWLRILFGESALALHVPLEYTASVSSHHLVLGRLVLPSSALHVGGLCSLSSWNSVVSRGCTLKSLR